MIKNAKVDKVMSEIIKECESGESIYSPQEEQEISLILYEGISKGENFAHIYEKKIKDNYPLPHGPGLVESHIRLRQLYADMVQKYKKAVSIDKEFLWEELYSKYSQMFDNEEAKHDIVGQKKVLDSMVRLLGEAQKERMLNKAEESDKDITYVLDFNI